MTLLNVSNNYHHDDLSTMTRHISAADEVGNFHLHKHKQQLYIKKMLNIEVLIHIIYMHIPVTLMQQSI